MTSGCLNGGRAEELQQQAADFARLFLLHPMSGAFDQMNVEHARAGAFCIVSNTPGR